MQQFRTKLENIFAKKENEAADMTRGELQRRDQAVIAGFVERDADKARGYIEKLININAHGGVLFRFRPPKDYEIEALESNKIFLCRPSVYEDSGDCEILFDIKELCKYFMLEMKPEIYGKYAELDKEFFYDKVMRMMEVYPKFIELKEQIRDQALVSCFTEQYSENMWNNYANDSEGICLKYNLRDIILNVSKELMFYPVRYVDSRKEQQDIYFTSNEYNIGNDPEPAHLKFLLSCLTKERMPYSSEAEWRLFYDKASLGKDEKGQYFDFQVKPIAIILGENIDRHSSLKKRVEEYASKNDITLCLAQNVIE